MRIAVVGAGLMGQGIAVAFARAGHDVAIHDRSAVLDGAAARTAQRIASADVAEGIHSGAAVRAASELADAVVGADFVIEAVSENEQSKAEVLAQLDAIADPATVFATNTSSLPIDRLRMHVGPGRTLIACHFFNPAEIVPGVEVASLPDDPAGREAATRLIETLDAMGNSPVRVSPVPGFIGNRLQLALFREAALCVEEGLATPEEVDTVVRTTFGFRLPAFGPFEVADMAGLGVYEAILATLEETYGERFSAPASLLERTRAGRLGLASGSGYLEHPEEQRDAVLARRDDRYRTILEAATRPAADRLGLESDPQQHAPRRNE